MDDHALAVDIEAKLEELGEPSAELTYNLGIMLDRADQREEAARYYRRATEMKPDFAEALLNLGHALKALGQEDEARASWQQALEAKPELAESYF
jgi:tetratricopeptide (TPR) repeat protein